MSDTDSMGPIGLIGLGLLGNAIAQRLLSAGFSVWGHDIAPGACEEAESLGVMVRDSPAALAEGCRFILLSLPNSEIRQELLFGASRLASVLRDGTVLLDTTTGRADDLERDAHRLSASGVALVDVCVLASSAQTAQGEAVLLVGETATRAARYRGLLDSFSRQIFFLGKPGDGCRTKLVANQVLGLHRLVLAEALGLADKVGLNLDTTLDVLRSGMAASAVMDTKGRKMLDQDFAPVARMAQHAKDVDLILELGTQVGAHLPLSALHQSVLHTLIGDGFGAEDNAAVIRAFREGS